ncbi:MAG: DoxX family membrane protein [Alphaproteobacteria bacterium]|nr:DoxX family membrane protein [Alphaproteobacteria bacterium]
MIRRFLPRLRALYAGLCVLAAVWITNTALAHERFIPHRLKNPLCLDFFKQTNEGAPLGIHWDTWNITARVFLIICASILIWFLRQPIEEFLLRRVFSRGGATVQRIAHGVTSFLTDKPVRATWFRPMREFAVQFFMRSPALVLMFSATNDSLVMPSFPLDPSTAGFLKAVQAVLAILILAQALLPLVGTAIIATWFYMAAKWGLMVSIDAAPVLTVAVVYLTSPWQSHRIAITNINREQMVWLRRVLGIGFCALGWLKLYNHDLTAGVADNFESVMGDPLVQMLKFGTVNADAHPRETWVIAFGLAEIMSGFLLTIGVFSRFWAMTMTFVFAKLMILDFGFEEIPHIYPISAMLCVIFNNDLSSELDVVEAVEEEAGATGRAYKQTAVIWGATVGVAFLVLVPGLWVVTRIVTNERPERGVCLVEATADASEGVRR